MVKYFDFGGQVAYKIKVSSFNNKFLCKSILLYFRLGKIEVKLEIVIKHNIEYVGKIRGCELVKIKNNFKFLKTTQYICTYMMKKSFFWQY